MSSTQMQDKITVLRALDEIPFPVGKTLLIDFLRGSKDNQSIMRNKLYRKGSFSALELYQAEEIQQLIDSLIQNNLIGFAKVSGKGWKVMTLTLNGQKEIVNPTILNNDKFNIKQDTEIKAEERELFRALDPYLSYYNDLQKKAIIADNPHILCIAGAGSGKTTVLTRRIDFLIRYRSVSPRKILAITFTRKAKEEMQNRLGDNKVHVHTFNSFCEKQLNNFSDLIYGREVRVIGFKERMQLLNKGLQSIGTNIDRMVDIYFPKSKRDNNPKDKLMLMFMNDCYSFLDLMKLENMDTDKISTEGLSPLEKQSLEVISKLSFFIQENMKRLGLRDYTDQLIDAIEFFNKHSDYIPSYDHILVDEYQDINSQQMELINLLAPKNLFCVGDPRQSIYGWRGSKIDYILDFKKHFSGSEVIHLVRNYRSQESIVSFINLAIKNMGLPDLKSEREAKNDIFKHEFKIQEQEYQFIVNKIMGSTYRRNEIFVLSRTNKQLRELSSILAMREIDHVLATDEQPDKVKDDQVILSTIHAAKGLEGKMVFVMGANSINLPCRTSDHPVMDLIKIDDYNKEEEERRLFYVALSRAMEELHITYTGRYPTRFLTKPMVDMLNHL